jgi:hypothetical protein
MDRYPRSRSRRLILLAALTASAVVTSAMGLVSRRPVTANEQSTPAAAAAPPAGAGAGPTKAGERLREGTRLVDVSGTFTPVGADGVTFSPDGGKDAYRLLQNLALERISRTLEEQRVPGRWIVSGLITEYRGANYLLVTKAQLQSADTPASGP